jgi:hypothetical protein
MCATVLRCQWRCGDRFAQTALPTPPTPTYPLRLGAAAEARVQAYCQPGTTKGVATPLGATPSRVSCWCVFPRAAGACSCALAVLANCSRRVLWRWIYTTGMTRRCLALQAPASTCQTPNSTRSGRSGKNSVVGMGHSSFLVPSLDSHFSVGIPVGDPGSFCRGPLSPYPRAHQDSRPRYHNRGTHSRGCGLLRAILGMGSAGAPAKEGVYTP